MAIATTQTVSGGAVSGNPATSSWTPVAGRLVVVGVIHRSVGITVSLAGNGQTWLTPPTPSKTGDRTQQELHMFYAIMSSPSAGVTTATLSVNTLPSTIVAVEMSGTDTTTPIFTDAVAGTGGTDNATAIGNLTTTYANSWFLHFIGPRNGSVTALDGTLTSDIANILNGSGGNAVSLSAAHKFVASPGAVGASSTLDAARDWITWTAEVTVPVAAIAGSTVRGISGVRHQLG